MNPPGRPRRATPARSNIPTLTLGWRLRMALEHGESSKVRMASAIAIAPETLANWMKDRTVPHPLITREIARITGVDAHWLITGIEAKP